MSEKNYYNNVLLLTSDVVYFSEILVCKIQVYKKFQKVQQIFSETSDISLNIGIGHKLPLRLSKYTL